MELKEEMVSQQTVYEGSSSMSAGTRPGCWMAGSPTGRWWSTPAGWRCLPWTGRGRVALVRQFRYPLGEVTLELPAGLLWDSENYYLVGWDGTKKEVRHYRVDKMAELAVTCLKLEPGEDPRASGLRELAEETGLTPGTFLPLGSIASSPGILAERIHLFFARDLVQGEARPDDGEFVETLWVPYQDLLDMARRGEIQDGKTLAGILKASFLLEAPQT